MSLIGAMNLENKVIDKINEVWDKAEQFYNRRFYYPSIKFTKRGKVAGTANCTTNVLNFNMVLLKENTKDFINQTVPHECAHLLAHQIYNRQRIKPHGNEWKSIMIMLGVKPKRCHSYDTSNSTVYRRKTFNYKCGCMVHSIGLTRHKRAQIGAMYKCRKCNQVLKWDI